MGIRQSPQVNVDESMLMTYHARSISLPMSQYG